MVAGLQILRLLLTAMSGTLPSDLKAEHELGYQMPALHFVTWCIVSKDWSQQLCLNTTGYGNTLNQTK